MKKPLGVWFTFALAIFVLSIWGGYYLGRTAAAWHFFREQRTLAQSDPERAAVDSINATLNGLATPNFLVELNTSLFPDPDNKEKYLLSAVVAIEKTRNETPYPEVRAVADLNVTLAYVFLATTQEQQGKKSEAGISMHKAQLGCRTLGWPDCSGAKLRAVANERLEHFNSLLDRTNSK